MQTNRVASLLIALISVLLIACPHAEAAACPKICDQKSIWGIGPTTSGSKACECKIIKNGRGSSETEECGCGPCYLQAGARVSGFEKQQDGTCPFNSTYCGDCDLPDSGSGGNSTSTKTPAPSSTNPTASDTPSPSLTSATPSPSGASSSASGNTSLTSLPPVTPPPSPTSLVPPATDVPSNATTAPTDGKSGSSPANATSTAAPSTSSKSGTNDGLATWQIALIICSSVLVMAVVMMTITSCYCKARNRMKDNLQDEEERVEYEGYWNPNGSGGMTTTSGHEQLGQPAFNGGMAVGGRNSFNSTHSRPNSAKNMPYSEPTYAEERIGAGMGRPPARQSLGSTGDLPGVFQPFPQREMRPSGSRTNIAIEL